MIMAGNLYMSFILVIGLLTQYSYQATPPRVKTKLGAVVGTARQGEDRKMIYSFMGIPYIKPPVGELRFKPPQPAEPWTDDFYATSDMAICPQKLFGPVMGSEDCVKLNVYTPLDPSSAPPSKPLSVMVFIHGGGFIMGSSASMMCGHPDYLLHHDVVLVMINYRLGVFGFLSTEDEAASGNYGLLDQVEALKWVKNNIVSFGGNPDDVTIFGESAGAASVHYLMLTPLAKGLFKQAISQSGSSICPWAASSTSRSMARTLARKVGCPEKPSDKLVECLRGVDATKLVTANVLEPNQKIGDSPSVWLPRTDSEAAEPFLPKHPIELMTTGAYNKVPLLIGHTRNEGAMFMAMGKELYKLGAESIKNNWDQYCKVNLGMVTSPVEETKGSELCKRVKEQYIDSSKDYEDNKMAYADLLGDAQFTSGIYKSSEMMSRHSPVYNFLFNYESENISFFKLLIPTAEKVKGVIPHADELMYLFKYSLTGWTKKSPEYEMVEMMSEIWTKFAKTGVPSIPKLNTPWPKATWPNHDYVVIDTQPSVQQSYKPEKMKMFDEVYSNSLYRRILNPKEEL